MNIYIICAVRNAGAERIAELRTYAEILRERGHHVHFPPDDAPQEDQTGEAICRTHLAAMTVSDEVHVFWNVRSSGSHFDLGMAYALGRKIVPVECEHPDGPEKSYWKVMHAHRPSHGPKCARCTELEGVRDDLLQVIERQNARIATKDGQ